MAKHEAILDFADKPKLGTKGLVVTVKVDDDIIGHLMVGKASLVWFKKGKKSKGHKVSWKDLQEWMLKKPEKTAKRP